MPELPEVETVRRSLAPQVVGKKIIKVEVHLPRMVKGCKLEYFTDGVVGRRIQRLDRRGKFLLLRLDNGHTLVVHLGMTGRFFYTPKEPYGGFPKHTHAVFHLDDGDLMVYFDPRTFGRLTLACRPEEVIPGLREMGPEPLGKSFTPEYLLGVLRKRKGKIKQLLLDQRIIAGIGNIYADEALFDAGIHPERSGSSLSDKEVARLYHSLRRVLNRSVRHRGTTISDYVDGRGVPGEFQNLLKVYGREGETCPGCESVIKRIPVAGRSSHFCPRCQV